MPIDPKDFFSSYVIQPYEEWIRDELCEWKAFAVANGLNAMVECMFLRDNPMRTVFDKDALGKYREGLPNRVDHDHIRFVAEVCKHLERRDQTQAPNKLDDMDIKEAGPFSREFSMDFDVARDQLGFPYQSIPRGPSTWMPLRAISERCIDYWKGRLGIP